jgi:hypothetical protein
MFRRNLNREDVTMSYQSTHLLNSQDRLIYRAVASFLSMPLMLLLGAAAAVAG